MKNVIFILFLALLSASCCRWIPQKCIITEVDTTYVVKYDTLPPIVKDTTIYKDVFIKGDTDTAFVDRPVQVDPESWRIVC